MVEHTYEVADPPHRWPSNEDADRPASVDRCLACGARRFSDDPDDIVKATGPCLGHRPRMAYFVDETMKTANGYVPAVVTEGEPGYNRMTGNGAHARPWYWGDDLNKAKEIAVKANAEMGLSPQDVHQIIMSSVTAQIRKDSLRQKAEERWERIQKGRD